MKLLVTGGVGFIGSNFVHYILQEHSDWYVTNLDKLTYAGNLENLKDIENEPRYTFVKGDIADWGLVDSLLGRGFDVIVNFAAESHVDRSIMDSFPFLETNIKGTQTLLEVAKKYRTGKFIQISTDEVYGSRNEGYFNEESALSPSSPYAASKACADLMCLSFWKTHRVPVIITRCTNNFGPYQFPEKLIPLVITNALENKLVPVYGDGLNVRDWIYVINHCRAIDLVIQKGQTGQIYNIGGGNEKRNLDIIKLILEQLHKPKDLIQFVTDRPGHDRRYALDSTRINKELGWQPVYSFEATMAQTVDWYLANRTWWQRIKGKEYADYYEKVYLKR